MRTKYLLVSFIICFIFSIEASAQNSVKINNNRYIVIDNIETFFEISEKDVICYPIIHNIFVNESSKPLHINVNELPNVIKFSIKSNSGAYENQRQCKLVMKPENYLDTFRRALIIMDIKYILYNDEFLTIDQFYLLSK